MSEYRGGLSRLTRDAELLALLLLAPPSDIAQRLMPSAKLLGSGLLELDRFGCLAVQDQAGIADQPQHFPGSGLL